MKKFPVDPNRVLKLVTWEEKYFLLDCRSH